MESCGWRGGADVHPVLLELGPLQLPSYGVLLLAGIALGLYLAGRRAERAAQHSDQ